METQSLLMRPGLNGCKGPSESIEETVYLQRPAISVEEVRSDPTAECRWWNSLSQEERTALVHGARTSREIAANDWLDIGETNRLRILDAAYAVECWMTAD